MTKSISYVMEYTHGGRGLDRIGGLPTHLPCNWPRCHAGQEQMAFMAQLYASDWFPIDGLLCLQFYTCVGRCVLAGCLTDPLRCVDLLHVECVPVGASENKHKYGVSNPDLANRTIAYYPTEDSIDHETFLKIISDNDQPWPDVKDSHHYQDRLAGTYTFDGSETGITISASNRCIGHFRHPCVRGTTIYLWQSDDHGIYATTYS